MTEKTSLRDMLRTRPTFFQDVISSLTDRGRRLLEAPAGRRSSEDLASLCDMLLSSRGEASGAVIAGSILDTLAREDKEARAGFFALLLSGFGIDAARAVAATEAYRDKPSAATMRALQDAVEPRRQELLRRLNQVPGATARLVALREDLLALLPEHPELREVDLDFAHLFQSWFNRGFLQLRAIDWNTPAAILDRIIRYEAVHEISDWDDLRRRIDPADRRLYAFFHPSLPDEPLIFVEVALTAEIPSAIAEILSPARAEVSPEEARTAVFYSISNCQDGLRGISFGNFLIKQVVEELSRDLPRLKTFVTLSPVPGFARWLAGERRRDGSGRTIEADAALARLDSEGWWEDGEARALLQPLLTAFAADYLAHAKGNNGGPLDPVARFHLGNGARLERINWPGDLGPVGLRTAHGVMVNYLYRPEDIEKNHEALVNEGRIAMSPAVRRLARDSAGVTGRTAA